MGCGKEKYTLQRPLPTIILISANHAINPYTSIETSPECIAIHSKHMLLASEVFMRKTIILLLSISSTVSATELKQGQAWKYKTRLEEENSAITILKIENFNGLGKVVHVRVDNIQLMNPLRGKAVVSIPYIPFKESAIKRSIAKLVREVPMYRTIKRVSRPDLNYASPLS